jgi:hypothetical protein
VPLEIETVAVAVLLVPPGPEQLSEYTVAAVRGPVLCVPLVGSAPLQPPEAEHAVALVELHVNVDEPPEFTAVGLATSVAIGITLTRTVDTALVPPIPVQVNEYDVGNVRGPVLRDPLVAWVPLQLPDAVHDIAFVDVHVSVAAALLATEVGFAANVIVGTGSTVIVTVAGLLVPPVPAQTSEYTVVAVSAPVL